MTLFKQLALILTTFLVLILITVMGLNFKTATEFAQNQLATEAKNTAHSLGLSLSKVADPTDPSTMETMINAIFDSGYYTSIVLLDTANHPLISRQNRVIISDVPQWFVSLIPITATPGESKIIAGWNQIGTLQVVGHPGHAYRQLYHSWLSMIQTFALFGTLIIALLYLILGVSLKPLKTIKKQAEAIIGNTFIFSDKKPFTTDLQSVTMAMNTMVVKVQEIFNKENETLKQYQELLYKDIQTSLPNRRYIMSKISDYLSTESPLNTGTFFMISLDDHEKSKHDLGYDNYNTLIKTLGHALESETSGCHDKLLGRLSEGDFFAILPGQSVTSVSHIISSLLTTLKNLPFQNKEHPAVICASLGLYHAKDTLRTLLSRADLALAQAQLSTPFGYKIAEDPEGHIPFNGKEELRRDIAESLLDHRMMIALQNVTNFQSSDKPVYHKEVFLRLKDKKSDTIYYNAGYFLPIAAKFSMLSEIDRYTIQKTIATALHETNSSFAINLSSEFISNVGHMGWLQNELASCIKKGGKQAIVLAFEVSNSIAVRYEESVTAFAKMVRSYGHQFGIDQFTIPQEGVGYLQEIKPHYLKINSRYLKDMMIDSTTGMTNQSLSVIAKSLSITLIATNIEDQRQQVDLEGLGITTFQGSFIAPVILDIQNTSAMQ